MKLTEKKKSNTWIVCSVSSSNISSLYNAPNINPFIGAKIISQFKKLTTTKKLNTSNNPIIIINQFKAF